MRPIWSGAVSFGLVTIPVRLYPATTSRRPKFRQLRHQDHSPIRYRKVADADGREVPREEIVRGYEFEKGRYVVLTDEEIAGAAYQGGPRIVDVAAFVDAFQIDPVYYRTSYYLEPGPTGEKAYSLLRTALAETDRVGIATVAIRSRQHLASIRPREDLLVLETMHWPDEIRAADFGNLETEVEPLESELAMAKMLIENLATDFDPEQWKDTTRQKIEELVAQKIEGKEIVASETPEPTRVVDLLEALKASVEATREQTAHRKAG
ncbi:MAG: Ku protein [bacterium]|nr:Ku protein [bacterium]